MRALIIIAGTALALSACGNNDQTDNTQNADENLTAESIVSNDVTAIDAVTGDAANMAADVNYQDFDNSVTSSGGNDAASTAKPHHTPPRPSRTPDEPAASTTNSATTNAQ